MYRPPPARAGKIEWRALSPQGEKPEKMRAWVEVVVERATARAKRLMP
jgi:hypothetical protein